MEAVLFSSGFRATVEGLPNVHSSSTIHRATSMDGNCTAVSAKFKANFISFNKSYSVIPLFRYSIFHILPTPIQIKTLASYKPIKAQASCDDSLDCD